MKKKWIKPFVLIIVFIGALFFFSMITNKSNENLTTAMADAVLPLVRFSYNGTSINELHGYVNEMDVTKMRDTITPLDNSRLLSMEIDTYGMEIDGISYEIRAIDGERLVADGSISDYSYEDQKIRADITIQNLLEEEAEYNFILNLETEKGTLYYYTRIMQTTACYVDECLDFAMQFHDYTFREDADEFIPTYMEAATGDPTTLNYVDLTCTLKQITWAQFKGRKLTRPAVSVKEINTSYNAITLDYVMSDTNEAGETEYYNVEEYYRLRDAGSRMYVLNFERRMNQIFRGENTFITDQTKIQLGIRDTDVKYAASEAGDIVCFVQEGELWCFNLNNGELSQVFSFRSAEGMEPRENWAQHDINIVRIDEAGSVDFIVYGYMNRGTHEGECGVAIYHFDGLAHTVEEEAFIPAAQSYELLKAELGQLLFENDQEQLYLMLTGDVYQIDLATRNAVKIMTGLKEGCYAASPSGRYFAWTDAAQRYSSSELKLMDLKDGSVHTINEGEGVYLQALGFIGEDFIYGIANAANVKADAAGNMEFPMTRLKILNTSEGDYQAVKDYSPGNSYIGGISVSDYTVYVMLVSPSDGQYVHSGDDIIMNREVDTAQNVAVTTTATDVKETQVQIAMKKEPQSDQIKRITPTEVIVEEDREIAVDAVRGGRFYVYVKGDVLLATDSISDAILAANEKLGVVVDSDQEYIWMRARKNYQNAFRNLAPNEADLGSNSIVQCISAMLAREGIGISVKDLVGNGETPKEVLENTLKDDIVLDLTGCTVEEIIFYVSQGNPVFAMTGSDSAVLIAGYTANTISYYDPQKQEISTINFEEADNWFQRAGNVFFSYLK